jgi:hypothetical protein
VDDDIAAIIGEPSPNDDGSRESRDNWPSRRNTAMHRDDPKRLADARFSDRVIRAPRGSTRTAKSWLTEAPLRMLMNNLDPEVASGPHELVVYGGIGRACAQLGVLRCDRRSADRARRR